MAPDIDPSAAGSSEAQAAPESPSGGPAEKWSPAVGGRQAWPRSAAETQALTVSDICETYVKARLRPNVRNTSSAARGVVDNHIKPLIGDKLAWRLTATDVAEMRGAVAAGSTRTPKSPRGRPVAGGPQAANSALKFLSAAYGFADRQGHRLVNPVCGVGRFKGREVNRLLADEEVDRLSSALAAEEARGVFSIYALAAIRLIASTGCRKTEILGLRWDDCERLTGHLKLNTKCGVRAIPVGRAVFDLIERLPRRPGSPYVLPGRRPSAHVCVERVWRRVRRFAGLPDLTIHQLRHAFAGRARMQGADLFEIQQLLGHKSIRSTLRYLYVRPDAGSPAAESLANDLLGRLGTGPLLPEGARAALEAGKPTQEAPEPPSRWLDTHSVAARANLAPGTLMNLRRLGLGPAWRRVGGGQILYAPEDVAAWLCERETARRLACDKSRLSLRSHNRAQGRRRSSVPQTAKRDGEAAPSEGSASRRPQGRGEPPKRPQAS